MDSRCPIPKFLPGFKATLTSTARTSRIKYVVQFTVLTNEIHEIESQFLAIFDGTEFLVEHIQVTATPSGNQITAVGIAVFNGVAAVVTSR
jgi:hypothetical protein